MKLESVLVVYKRSAYEVHCEEERDPRILQLVAEDHFTVQDMFKAHVEHRETVERVGTALEELKLAHRFVRRTDLRDTLQHDLVVTVGGDGTFLDASHHVRDKPMLGVNSAPSQSVGVFCGAHARNVKAVLAQVVSGKLQPVALNRCALLLNGNAIVEPVLNEVLVCAQNPAMTARYVIESGKRREHHKSSGVYIGPAAGSSASMRAAGAELLPLTSKKVQWVVREPYRDGGPRLGLVRGVVPKTGFAVWSKMRTGMIYVDGAHVRYRFDFGDRIELLTEFLPLPVLGIKRRAKK